MAERKGCRLRTNPLFARQMRAIEKQIDDVPRKPESSVKARKKDRLAESPSEDPYRNPRSGVTSSVLARRRRNASPLRESSERQKESTEGVESSGNTPWSSMTEARKRVPSFLTTPKEKRQRSSREFERGSTGSSARCRRQLHSPLETGEIEEERCRYCHTYLESGSKCNCQRRIYQGPATSNIVQQFADSASHTPDPSPVVVLQGCQVGTCFLTEDAYSRLAPMGMLDDSVIDFFMQFVYNFILTEAQRDQFYFLSPFFFQKLEAKQSMTERNSVMRGWTNSLLRHRNKFIWDFDYIFLPINDCNHWYLCVVTFPWKSIGPLNSKRLQILLEANNSYERCPSLRKGEATITLSSEDESEPESPSLARAKKAHHRPESKKQAGRRVYCSSCWALVLAEAGDARRSLVTTSDQTECGALWHPFDASIIMLDSMREFDDTSQVPWRTSRLLVEFLESEYIRRKRQSAQAAQEGIMECAQWNVCVDTPVPKQENYFDCGVFVIEYVLRLCRGTLAPLSRRRLSSLQLVSADDSCAKSLNSWPENLEQSKLCLRCGIALDRKGPSSKERSPFEQSRFELSVLLGTGPRDHFISAFGFGQRHISWRRQRMRLVLEAMQQCPQWSQDPEDIKRLVELFVTEPSEVELGVLLEFSADRLCVQDSDTSGFESIWKAARGTSGVRGQGLWQFEVYYRWKYPHQQSREVLVHYARVGISTPMSATDLGESPDSWCLDSTGSVMYCGSLRPYCRAWEDGDVIGVLVDLTRMKVSFLLNGKLLGDAFSLPEGVRTSGFLPHVCLRNARLELNTKQQSSFHEIVQPQTIFIGDAPAHKSVENSVERPASLSDCECICMVGLPAAGKSSWVERHCARSKGRNFAVLSVRGMVSRMRTDPSVPSAASDWSAARSLFEKSVALLCAGWPRPRHSIIDDCNTDSAGRNRLLKRLQVMGLVQAIVVMPEDCEYKARRAQAEAADGCVTEQELVRLQSYLTMPEKGPMCADVHWAELGESACTDLAREYRRLARERARKLEIGVIKDHTSPPIQHISPRRLSSNMNVPEETRGFAQERILKVRLPGQTTTSPRETTLTVRLPKTAASSCPRDGVARHAVTLCPRKDHRRVEPYPSGRRVNVVSRGMADSSVLHTQPELDRSTRVVTVGCPSAPSSEVISTQRISPDRGGKNIGDKLLKGTRKIFLTGSRIVRRNAFLN